MIGFLIPLSVLAGEGGRFLHQGDGKVIIINKHTSVKNSSPYRLKDGTYSPKAIRELNAVFGMPASNLEEDVSLRLISILDYLQDRYLEGKTLKLISGYRSPAYNEKLRRQGKTAGQTSYHREGMAADIEISAADAQKIWEEFRKLEYGGVGIYGGGEFHVDSGKPRFWTSKTALPQDKEPPENRNIYLSTDQDIYRPGEDIRLFFSGISNYPFGVKKKFKLSRKGKNAHTFVPAFHRPETIGDKNCMAVRERKDARLIHWTLPINLSKGEYAVEVEFCGTSYSKMPLSLTSRKFLIDHEK